MAPFCHEVSCLFGVHWGQWTCLCPHRDQWNSEGLLPLRRLPALQTLNFLIINVWKLIKMIFGGFKDCVERNVPFWQYFLFLDIHYNYLLPMVSLSSFHQLVAAHLLAKASFCDGTACLYQESNWERGVLEPVGLISFRVRCTNPLPYIKTYNINISLGFGMAIT